MVSTGSILYIQNKAGKRAFIGDEISVKVLAWDGKERYRYYKIKDINDNGTISFEEGISMELGKIIDFGVAIHKQER